MTELDTLITSDLAALREDNQRQLAGIDDALQRTNMYRDDRPGAEARRDALAEERRRELVMMPLTLAHVFAHRVGRAAAGAAALGCAALAMLLLADPLLFHLATWFVPGLDLGMGMALAALAILAVYVIATWAAEAWFARRMRQAIRVGDDAYRDLDELARGPLEIAGAAVQRVDGLSIGLMIAGTASLTLVFGYVIVIEGAYHELWHTSSIASVVASSAFARHLATVLVAAFGAALVGLVVGRACSRPAGNGLVLRALGHWTMWPVAMLVGGATFYQAFHVIVAFQLRSWLPPAEVRYALAIGAAVSLVLPVTWSLLWWRRREQARIGER